MTQSQKTKLIHLPRLKINWWKLKSKDNILTKKMKYKNKQIIKHSFNKWRNLLNFNPLKLKQNQLNTITLEQAIKKHYHHLMVNNLLKFIRHQMSHKGHSTFTVNLPSHFPILCFLKIMSAQSNNLSFRTQFKTENWWKCSKSLNKQKYWWQW